MRIQSDLGELLYLDRRTALLPPGPVHQEAGPVQVYVSCCTWIGGWSWRSGTAPAGPVHQEAGPVQVYVSCCTWIGGWSWRSGTAPARAGTPGSRAGITWRGCTSGRSRRMVCWTVSVPLIQDIYQGMAQIARRLTKGDGNRIHKRILKIKSKLQKKK